MLGSRQFAVPQFDLFSSGTDLSCEPLSGFPNLLALEIFFFRKTFSSVPLPRYVAGVCARACFVCVHAHVGLCVRGSVCKCSCCYALNFDVYL